MEEKNMKEKMSTNPSGKAATVLLFTFVFCLFGIGVPSARAATFTVDTLADDATKTACTTAADDCSLRGAITTANATAGDDTIDFSVTGDIVLLSALPALNSNIAITGPGARLLAVKRDPTAASLFRILWVLSGADVSIFGLTMSGGDTRFGSGFAIQAGGIANFGTLTLDSCALKDNRSANEGGILNKGTITINRSIISGNKASSVVGGISNQGTATINNSTLSGNSSEYGAGAIQNTSGVLNINNSTLSGNTAEYNFGGGIRSAGTLNLSSTVIAGNFAGYGPDIEGGVSTGDHNLIGNTQGITGALPGTNNITDVDALLGPLHDNGGPTLTHELLPSSPAIDAGMPNGNFIDQRGVPRVLGTAADIGAFESGTTVLTVNSTADTTDGSCDPLGPGANCTVREAILVANADPLSHESIFFDIPTADPGYDSASARHTISLTSNLPNIDTNLSIAGPGRERLTVRQAIGFAVVYIYTNGTPDVSFSGLTMTNGAGGISSFGAANISIRECLITGNSGSAVSAFKGSVNVSNSGLSNNGGGISSEISHITVDNSDISNNSSYGGIGVYLASLTVRHSTIANNTQQAHTNSGGEGAGIEASRSSLTIDHSTITGNMALSARVDDNFYPGEGGGIFLRGSDTVAVITNSTIAGNTARRGGGIEISNSSSLELQNTIVAANTAGTRPDVSGTISAGSFNLIGNGSGSTGLVNGVDGNQVGGISVAPIDPRLGPLANNGGPTRTRLPLCGSPAIDRGKNLNSLATDQRGSGFGRTFDDTGIADADGGDATDIGAVELQAALECNTAPVAVDDFYSVGEDTTLNAPSPGILGNDTDGQNDALTAILVSGPANGTLTLNSNGSFSYSPTANFNGSDSFTYKSNDGSLDSNVATVSIIVSPVNDAPVVSATPKTQSSKQYSDAIQSVTINASDLETPTGNLTVAFSYSKDGALAVPNLPAGMSQGGVAGSWTVSGVAGVSAGTYVITASVTDTGDGSAAAVTSSDTFTIVVTRENAIAAPRASNPASIQVASAGGTASDTTSEFCFDITELLDGSAGNTALITAATVQIVAVGGGGSGGITASPVNLSGGGIGSARVACFTLTLANTPANVYEVRLVIGGDYYTGTGTTSFTVFDPSSGFVSGGGWIINPNTGYRANFGVNVKYLKNGNAQGSLLYIEHRPDGDHKIKSTALNAKGGFAILPIAGGYEALIAAKGNYLVDDVGTGNYSLIARVIDKGTPGRNDMFGLKLIDPTGQTVPGFTFDPVLLGGGNNQVPKK